ncbi:MAG: family NAD(P)-dependent oxidoreductase [Phycisphaerales bacterium]|nr:family NAD(P)-dependent oxidoreductase [Phycisphaerales bacterium]
MRTVPTAMAARSGGAGQDRPGRPRGRCGRLWGTGQAGALACAAVFVCATLAGCAATPSNNGRVVVLVGASSGFGKGVAQKLADQGAHVVLAARRADLLEELARDCQKRGGQALAVTTDISKEQDVAKLTQAALDRFGRIDVWINLAGIGAFGRFEEIPLADHYRLIDVNLKGVITGSYYAMRQFRKQKSGTLINISSITGRIGQPYYASYAASKFALTGLGTALNQEVRLSGDKDIHVCTVYPFATDTPWWDHAANYTGHQPQFDLMDPPDKVVDAIVEATVKPEVEVTVGFKAKLFVAMHRINRRITENIAGDLTHKSLYEDAPPATMPAGPGSLHQPMPTGTEVDGGVRERMKGR